MATRREGILILGFLILLLIPAFAAASYAIRLELVIEKPVYSASEQIVLTGQLLQLNVSASDTSYQAVGNASINITIYDNSTGAVKSNYTLNTSSAGVFRSNSSTSLTEKTVSAPSETGTYRLEASYTDLDNTKWHSKINFVVLDQAVDDIIIRASKSRYYAAEPATVFLEAVKRTNGNRLPVSNVSLNGTLRYENLTTIRQFNCTTDSSGICSVSFNAPSSSGKYILEAKNFLAYSSFRVITFNIQAYMKDGLGQGHKETFRTNEQASVEVRIDVNGSVPTTNYTFNGTILDSSGSSIAVITSTSLETSNSYTNRFTFTISNQFTAGNYYASVNVYDNSGNSRPGTVFFQVREWIVNFYKASSDSGFEYEYVAFPSRKLNFEIYPKDRQNGSIVTGLNASQFNITMKSQVGSVVQIGNATWNSSCGTAGCYTFNLTSPSSTGDYIVSVSLNHSSDSQKTERKITVLSLKLSALSTTETGQQKDLFGTAEPVYLTLAAGNTTSSVNLTDASIINVKYENGTEFSYTNTTWFGVNVTDNTLHWAWNVTEQKLKLDPPKAGGVYTVKIGANSNTLTTTTRFIINPYDVCAVAKTAAGSIDSSSSFYAWQYKTTDTVYFELKMTQANNPAGRANSSYVKNATNFGTGSACSIDTTQQQVVANATISIEKITSSISGIENKINTTESVCKADNNQGAYTCTLKPLNKWESGRNIVELKVTGEDSQTSDKVVSMFETRTFFIYGYATTWANKPQSNITFTANMYNPGTNWWSNYGSGGLSGSITIQKVQYMGKNGEWVWPPIEISYNTTGVNSSNVSSGSGTFTLEHTRTPKKSWDPGSYSVIIKATDDASGESDYGEIWFEVKRWDAFSTPVEKSGTSFNYKYSFNSRENISLYMRITNAGDYNDNGGTSLGGNVSIGVQRVQQYTTWPPKEVNVSSYGVIGISVNQSSPWYYSANANTYANYVITIYPTSGTWENGYYNVVLDVNGTDTGWGWFNVISFTVQSRTTDQNGTNYVYNIKGSQPVYLNVTASKSWKTYYSAVDYVNTTFEDMTIRTWRQTGNSWQQLEYNYPENINVTVLNNTKLHVNGSAILNVTLSTGSWPAGWYNGDIKLKSVSGDNAGDSAIGYIYFNVQPFRVQASTSSYQVDYDSNVTATLSAYSPDWSSNTILSGNYSIKKITESQWTGSGNNYITYTNFTPANFTGQTQVNISPARSGSDKWSLTSGGYHYLTITVEDSNTGDTQDAWLSFRAMPMQTTIGTPYSQNSISATQNVTVPVTINSSRNSSSGSGNLSRVFEWSWPNVIEYKFTVGNCYSVTSGSCKITGTQNVTVHVPSSGWSEGWHYPEFEFTPTDDKSSKISAGSTWFRVAQAYSGSFSNYDQNNSWKYYFGADENASVKLQVTDGNYAGQVVNITKVEYAESGSSCWNDYCRTFVSASWEIINASTSKPNETIATGSVIRIIKPSGGWQRGDHVVRVNIAGPSGIATLKSGYFWVKDVSGPNATIVSPLFNATINASSFLFNVTTTENSTCTFNVVNYDSYNSWYCGGSNASTTYNTLYSYTCNTTTFKGASYYSNYASKWSDSNFQTSGTTHSYNFSTAGMPAQHYGAYLWCNDEDWNNVWASTVFKVNTSISTVNVTLTSPANNALGTASSISFNYSFTGPTSNCDLYTNSSGWAVNANQMSLNAGAHTTVALPLTNGTFIWNIKCTQTTNSTNFGWGASNRTLYVNITG
ncbi:MAG: hypothetical protein HY515_00640 [Candidatus Aenigmarchaeota archaeon]|nr:hypothetical protein [Candidatus Aenigmarchaeota archaeon]